MNKPILAIETSAKNCGVALFFSNSKIFEDNVNEQKSHSKIIFSLIEKCLKDAETKIEDCEAIAVSIGPGSFTGLRIGLAAAKGMAFGANLPIIPVPTFEAGAMEIYSKYSTEKFFIASKVNTEEVYVQYFFKDENDNLMYEPLTIISTKELLLIDTSIEIFTELDLKERGNYHYFSSPSSVSIAKWGMKNFSEKKVDEFDTLEPQYIKDFVIKRKRK